jgi:hypothetical protein
MIMEHVAGGELFDYIVKHGKVRIHETGWYYFIVLDTGLEIT